MMPPRWNGQPAPSSMHRSMSCGSATTPSASISPISSASADSARSRTCSAVEGWSPGCEQRGHLGVELLAAGVPDVDAGLAGLDQPAQVRRDTRSGRGRRRAWSRRRAARPPGRPGPAARTASSAGPSGASARSATSIGVPSSTAAVTSPRNRVSSRLTTKAGASVTSTADFFSVLATANAVARVASSVRCAADDLEQRQHRDRVEEVEADHPLGMRAGPRPSR